MNSRDRRKFVEDMRKKGLNPFAHTKSHNGLLLPDSHWELWPEHALEVSRRAEEFASVLHMGKAGRVCGLTHDLSKFDPHFEQRIRGILKDSFDHAGGGGRILDLPSCGWFTQPVLGHHINIPDDVEPCVNGGLRGVRDRIIAATSHKVDLSVVPSDREITEAFHEVKEVCRDALNASFQDDESRRRFGPFFIFAAQKFLYSCLVDADYLGTEHFYQGKERAKRYDSLEVIYERFMRSRDKLVAGLDVSNVSPWMLNMRDDVWQSALRCSEMDGDLFTLTSPTGSAKTLAYIAFALRKAIRDNKDRIFIVLPYCSIISQVSGVLRKTIGEKNVLEHHSGYDLDDQVRHTVAYKRALSEGRIKARASKYMIERITRQSFENWDAPVVVTSREQFDESFFCRYPGRSRKVHNTANSVIVIDEAQTTPRPLTIAYVAELHALRSLYNSSLVISTATQPSYTRKPERMWGLEGAKEIVEKKRKYFTMASSRVQTHRMGDMSVARLCKEIAKFLQVLVVVNTRKNSFLISQKLTEMGIKHFHINTLVNKRRVRQIIEECKRRLKAGQRCVLISTQIVEAGTDFSFPTGFLEKCPLDSWLQRTGRINRSGELPVGHAHMFTLLDGNTNPAYATGNALSEAALYACGDMDIVYMDTMDTFFGWFLKEEGNNLDGHGIVPTKPDAIMGRGGVLSTISPVDNKSQVLRTKFSAFDQFKYIGYRVSIVLPLDKRAKEAIEKTQDLISRGKNPGRRLLSVLQDYMVSIFEGEFESLYQSTPLEESHGFWILRDMSWYDNRRCGGVGLRIFDLPAHTK